MFGYKYKEDALKWRAQESDKKNKELARKFKLTIEIALKDGDFQYKTIEREGRMIDVGFLEDNWIIQSGQPQLERVYHDIKEETGKVGIESDSGTFFPHSSILHIRNVGIAEVTECH